jgi:hypothetical protein
MVELLKLPDGYRCRTATRPIIIERPQRKLSHGTINLSNNH